MQGIYTSLITPFYKDKVDYESLERLLTYQIKSKVQGLILLDTTGENSTLESTERNELITFITKKLNHQLPFFLTIEANCTRKAIRFMHELEYFKPDGFLMVTPYYNRPTQSGLYLHYEALAKETQKPICLYSSAFRCGTELAVDTIDQLRQAFPETIIAIKESGNSCNRVSQLLKNKRSLFHVLSGDDSLILPFLALGAQGAISTAANWIAKEMVQLFTFVQANDLESAAPINRNFYPLFRALTVETNPAPIKYILYKAGWIKSPEVRLPLSPLSAKSMAFIDQILEKLKAQS